MKARTVAALVALHTLTVAVFLGGCDPHGTTLKTLEASTCVLEDDRLSIAFKDPARARAYLVDLSKRLEGPETTTVVVDGIEVPLPVAVPSDREAVDEAIGLIQKIADCVPK
jgi:hypothetical protein